jgi:uncharacterized protein (DUF2267 family)
MSATGLAVFDSTLQKTNIWLDDLMLELEWDDRERAYQALRVVLHALRDHLPVNESAQFAAQLPQLLRGLYYEGWNPIRSHTQQRRWNEFTLQVTDAFSRDPLAHPGRVTEAVFRVLAKHVSSGEITDVRQCLPEEIRRHWNCDSCLADD